MRKIALSILLLGLLHLGASPTFAQCECAPAYRNITPHNEFKLAQVVFIGEVIEIKETAHDAKTDSYVETVKFKVKKAWKRDLDSIVIVTNTINGCANGFREKEEWLVYGYTYQDGALGTACCCSRTTLLSKAAADLKEFEEKGEKPTRIIEASN